MQARTHRRYALAMFAQGGKTDSFFDIVGERLDTSPAPILFVGPTKQFIKDQFEPRLDDFLTETRALAAKVSTSKRQTKTRKTVAGVPVRMAHAGSTTALKSDSIALVLSDEVDEFAANVKNQGNILRLIDRRGETFADFVHAAVSTPSIGPSEAYRDPDSGLEFWAEQDPDQIESAIWRMWQSGTRHHWAWPCPNCDEYFIPRFSCLKWDKPVDDTGRELKSDPMLAFQTARLECPCCGLPIDHTHKDDMNARGVTVAPGQSVQPDGTIIGAEPQSWTKSLWVSGLASPFVSWGQRAAEIVEAYNSGDPYDIQVCINASFGELYAPGSGEVPSWTKVKELASPSYVKGQVPSGVKKITAAVDVQKNCLYYTIRGWGERATSWLLEYGQLYGETKERFVWEDLEGLLQKDFDGIPIRLALIDAGFRPGKKDEVPVHRVYEFCQRNKRIARATKGSSTTILRNIAATKVDVNVNGMLLKNEIEHYRLDTDFFKRWVHERLHWEPDQLGAWLLPADVSEDFCKQMVSEARLKKASGRVKWVQRQKDNHYFDCEAMQAAAGRLENVLELRSNSPVHRVSTHATPQKKRKNDWFGERRSIW
ncbi:hypothetical protein GCM10007094_23800 [Pseudovibrio japonicus]|uniref:Uncharacterized protein n=1 Tax=Pseudovibrio japonicus TaxID=366534 RepID=A0ABQ3EJ53_9HYPH|nr:hypothetical protein GCM10007094_23800 [Pseudovibrio japonicus]